DEHEVAALARLLLVVGHELRRSPDVPLVEPVTDDPIHADHHGLLHAVGDHDPDLRRPIPSRRLGHLEPPHARALRSRASSRSLRTVSRRARSRLAAASLYGSWACPVVFWSLSFHTASLSSVSSRKSSSGLMSRSFDTRDPFSAMASAPSRALRLARH